MLRKSLLKGLLLSLALIRAHARGVEVQA